MIAALGVASVLLLVIAFLCWRLSRLHRVTAFHLRTIARMLDHLESPHAAYLVARTRRDEAKRLGIWKS